jgi:hypothetical protein
MINQQAAVKALHEAFDQAARTAFLAHLAAAGWQIVPVVATERMQWAALSRPPYDLQQPMYASIYTAMLAAAPRFPERAV